jgi:DNA-binding GntR family transcriptional regulator
MMEIKKVELNINRETLVDRIVEILEDRILTGELEPKTRLSEIRVSNEFGVSRAPAREALQRLEDMNLVRKTHLTREVVKFSYEEFRDTYELKNVVEAFGAMKGALKATNWDLRKIQSVMKNMKKYLDSGKFEKLRYLNYQFHDLMVKCSGNEKLITTYLSLVKQVRWATSLSLLLPGRPQNAYEEHQAIFKQFKQGEAEKVRSLLETHSNDNMERIFSQLENKERHEKALQQDELLER